MPLAERPFIRIGDRVELLVELQTTGVYTVDGEIRDAGWPILHVPAGTEGEVIAINSLGPDRCWEAVANFRWGSGRRTYESLLYLATDSLDRTVVRIGYEY